MESLGRIALLLALPLASSACVVEDVGATGSGSSSGAAAPEVNALFEPLAAPTPDRLGGVWGTTSTNASGRADLRFRFADRKVVGGVRCTFTTRNDRTMTVGQVGTLAVGDPNAKEGELRLGSELAFSDTEGDLKCEGKMQNVSWLFSITGTTLVLSAAELGGSVSLTKLGD